MLGGGNFTAKNKVLGGTYINFVSAARASVNMSDRGVVAVPMSLNWGVDGKVFTVTQAEFQKESLALFGYDYTADEIKDIREIFRNATKVHFFRLNGDGVAATGGLATAVCKGTRGNDLQYVVSVNVDDEAKFDVKVYLGTSLVDEQVGIATAAELVDNDFVKWNKEGSLAEATQKLSGGSNGSEVKGTQHQTALAKLESYNCNILCCATADETVIALYEAFTKRLRDQVGVKFQCVVYKHEKANYEGIVSVENKAVDGAEHSLVFWTAGALAGCAVNKSNTNKVYDGEYTVDVDYTQTELEAGILAGKFMFHSVEDEVRVLTDINTLTKFTEDKNSDFSKNQVIRVLDQIGNDIAATFNSKYLGQVQNDKNGRVSLWADIVAHHRELETLRAIQDFNPDELVVEAVEGDKTAVQVSDAVIPTAAMEKLYMTVVVH